MIFWPVWFCTILLSSFKVLNITRSGKFSKFGLRGCQMVHSKKFLGDMLCPSVQQPQREKIPHWTCRFGSCVNYNRSSSFVHICTIWKCMSRRVHACSKNWNCIWLQQVWLHQITNFCSLKPTFQNFVASRVRTRAILRDLKSHYWSWVLSIMIWNTKQFFEIYAFWSKLRHFCDTKRKFKPSRHLAVETNLELPLRLYMTPRGPQILTF